MNHEIRFFLNIKCIGTSNIYLTKLPSAFSVNSTHLPFLFSSDKSAIAQKITVSLRFYLTENRQVSMCFLRYTVRLIRYGITLKMIVVICFLLF
jgi:hypothetical protein